MEKKKKSESLYVIDGKKIFVREEDIVALWQNETESAKVQALAKFGYDVQIVKPEVKEKKKKQAFSNKKAVAYIKAVGSKKDLAEYEKIADEARKKGKVYSELVKKKKMAEENEDESVRAKAPKNEDIKAARKEMIVAGRESFTKQKQWFINKYGEDEYERARKAE